MRLVSFSPEGAGSRALGALLDGHVLELARAAAALDVPEASPALLATMETLLEDWDHGLLVARETVARATGLSGPLRDRLESALHPRATATLHPPVAHPPSIRDFYAFETHVRNARARRGLAVPPEWYEFPVFYFTNPGALVADGEPIEKPAWTEALDYELEIACVISHEARDVRVEDWRSVVAGFTIMNDWSARDIQRKEMAVGLGPAKGKDFATSLGPALVTLDELEPKRQGDRHDLTMEARVNGRTLSSGNARDLHFTFGQMIARASQDVYLFPGDVIGSGTMGGGCLLELGSEVHRWLAPGDEVTLEIERLGALTNRIV
jgi:fumarylacetoacetate (FAA) hydrolase